MLDDTQDRLQRRKEERERTARTKVRNAEESLQIVYTIIGCLAAGAIILYFGLRLANQLQAQWQAPYDQALRGRSIDLRAPGFQIQSLDKADGSYSIYQLSPCHLKVVFDADELELKIRLVRQDRNKRRAQFSTVLTRDDVEFRSSKYKKIKLNKGGQVTITVTVAASMGEVTIE